MELNIQIDISRRSMVFFAAILIAVGGVAGTVMVKDSGPFKVFTTLDMEGNPIKDVQWATSDDGSNSNLDADMLDGQEGSYYEDTDTNAETECGPDQYLAGDGTCDDRTTIGGGLSSGDSPDIRWDKCADSGNFASCSVSCNADEELVAVGKRWRDCNDNQPDWYDSYFRIRIGDGQPNLDVEESAEYYLPLEKGGVTGGSASQAANENNCAAGDSHQNWVTVNIACIPD